MLSFIIPIYNPDLKVFEACVKSLLDQSLKDWEAIFVLDGPCPEAEDRIKHLMKKKPNHYKVVKIEHSGACAARNAPARGPRSLRNCRGPESRGPRRL